MNDDNKRQRIENRPTVSPPKWHERGQDAITSPKRIGGHRMTAYRADSTPVRAAHKQVRIANIRRREVGLKSFREIGGLMRTMAPPPSSAPANLPARCPRRSHHTTCRGSWRDFVNHRRSPTSQKGRAGTVSMHACGIFRKLQGRDFSFILFRAIIYCLGRPDVYFMIQLRTPLPQRAATVSDVVRKLTVVT